MGQGTDWSSAPRAEMLAVRHESHCSLPTSLAPVPHVQRSALEIVQFSLRQVAAVQPRLNVPAQNALPEAVSLGEAPHDNVVQDGGNQVVASTLCRVRGIGPPARSAVLMGSTVRSWTLRSHEVRLTFRWRSIAL